MRRALPALAFALVGLSGLSAGCGDPDLWARWQAERALWHARSIERRAFPGHGAPSAHRLAALEARFQAIVEAFPASRWASPPAVRGAARQVAVASSEAALELAALAERTGRTDEALRRYEDVRRTWGALPGAWLKAALGDAALLERLGRYDDAMMLRGEIAGRDPLGDPDRAGPAPEILAMPTRLAADLRERGLGAQADSALTEADLRFTAALERAAPQDRTGIACALAGVRVARGDARGALAAWRRALATAPDEQRSALVLDAARGALAAGAPESTIVYAKWVQEIDFSKRIGGLAMLVEADGWEHIGQGDSAMACDDRVFARWNDPAALGPYARFQRARLLEQRGEWVTAQSELRALAAAYPTHPLAFEAVRQIVRYHLEHGETELARLLGRDAIANLERLLEQNRDPVLQRRARAVRADLLLAIGNGAQAESSLVDLWRRFPEDSLAQAAGLQAGELEQHMPDGQARAESLYADLAAHASSAAVRREARGRLSGRSAR